MPTLATGHVGAVDKPRHGHDRSGHGAQTLHLPPPEPFDTNLATRYGARGGRTAPSPIAIFPYYKCLKACSLRKGSSDQRERVPCGGAVAPFGWRPCRLVLTRW